MARRRIGCVVPAVAFVKGIGRIAGFIASVARRRLAARSGARAAGILRRVPFVTRVALSGLRQAVVCLLHAFVYYHAQKRA
ncbi:MAG: hypothetical protein OXF11_13990 [Deltaproteobacteria bacterium]|nr:hypothetical protein [Deltaproteobacteria bacterium]